MNIRKIAANYIFLPNSKLIKNGYIEIEGKNVIRIIDLKEIREIPGLEFYGGLIVAGNIKECPQKGFIEPFIMDKYRNINTYEGISIIEQADLQTLSFIKDSCVRKLI